eukprot:tig00000498_g1677.t1
MGLRPGGPRLWALLAVLAALQAAARGAPGTPGGHLEPLEDLSALEAVAIGEERRFRARAPGGEPLALRVQRFLELPAAGHDCPAAAGYVYEFEASSSASVGRTELKLSWLPRALNVSYFLADGANAQFVALEHERDVYGLRDLSVVLGDVIVDVGANIGIFAMAAGLLYPHATVVALEPVAETFGLLCRNVRESGLGNVRVLNVGLTADRRDVELSFVESRTIHASHAWRQFFLEAGSGREVHRARMVRAKTCTLTDVLLSYLPAEASVALIKMDCEGCEHEALDEPGAASLLHRVRSLRGELHLPRELAEGAGGPALRDRASRPSHLLRCLERELSEDPGPSGLRLFRCDEP